MARMPRLVVPGYPHHVTQRGNRRMKTFYNRDDYRFYLELLRDAKDDVGVEVWAYCLMPNHVHLVVVPESKESLAQLFRHVHRHYTRRINFRMNWRGHLWQERFHSFVMDESYLLATVRYTERNPVRAGLCLTAADWEWSSARAHIERQDDGVVSVSPMLKRIGNWHAYLASDQNGDLTERIRLHSRTGRPAGGDRFIDHLEDMTGRTLKHKKPGPRAGVR